MGRGKENGGINPSLGWRPGRVSRSSHPRREVSAACRVFLLQGCSGALQLFSLPTIYALGLRYLVTRDNQGVEKMLFKK